MSLIQEALRRQQEEAARQQPQPPQTAPAAGGAPDSQPPAARHISLQHPRPPAPPPVPEPTPGSAGQDKASEASAKGAGKALFGVTAIIVLILLLVTGLAWGGWRYYAAWSSSRHNAAGGASNQVAVATAAGEDPASTHTPLPPGAGVLPAGETNGGAANATGLAVAASTELPSSPGGVTATAQSAVTSGVSAVQLPPVHIPAPKPKWPSITLSGFIGRGDTGTAILNGQMIGVGESIVGVEVISIERRAVRLRFADETRTLQQGQTTEP